MGITDWLFRRHAPSTPASPSPLRERQRHHRERAKDERVRTALRAEIGALNKRMDEIARIAGGNDHG